MKIRLYNNRYLQLFAEAGESIALEASEDPLDPTVSLDLQDVIGIEGPQGPKGLTGQRGQSAKETLIDMGVLTPNATNEDFYAVIKGSDGMGVGIADIAVENTQNIHVDRVDCNSQGVCRIIESANTSHDATKTTLRVTMTDNTTKYLQIVSEAADVVEVVALNSTDYAAYFGSTTIPDGSGITMVSRNGTTLYLVPVTQLQNTIVSQ